MCCGMGLVVWVPWERNCNVHGYLVFICTPLSPFYTSLSLKKFSIVNLYAIRKRELLPIWTLMRKKKKLYGRPFFIFCY